MASLETIVQSADTEGTWPTMRIIIRTWKVELFNGLQSKRIVHHTVLVSLILHSSW